MKLVVPRKHLQEFRTKCRTAYPNEYMGALFGVRTDAGIEIHAIKDIEHLSNADGCYFLDKTITRSKMSALRAEKEFVGTIHSHCHQPAVETCEHMSELDTQSAVKFGELVCGIVYVFDEGHKTEVHWYVPIALPEVDYL